MSTALLPFFILSIILSFALHKSCFAIDNYTITVAQSIVDSETITSSPDGVFKLGFFGASNSSSCYVGIWYNNIPEQTIVWVANRDNPLKDSSGSLSITRDGNLVVLDGRGMVLWSTNLTNIASNNTMAELLDTGNLVLRDEEDGEKILWQSFENPADTFLATMVLGGSRRTGKRQGLTSWKSESDPSTGIFYLGLELTDIPQLVIWNGSKRHWRSGPWNNKNFIGTPAMPSAYSNGFFISNDDPEDNVYFSFKFTDNSVRRFALSHLGETFGEALIENKWKRFWSTNKNKECDVYGKCGPFGSCNILESPICSCLRGYTPRFNDDWSKGNWSGGCLRKSKLKCERNETGNSNKGVKEDGFVTINNMKVPDFAYWLRSSLNVEKCEQECLNNCSCLAYWHDSGVGCLTWSGNLVDISKFSEGGVDLNIRVAHSELDRKKNTKAIVIASVLIGAFVIAGCTYLCWRWMTTQKGKQKKDMETSLFQKDESSDPNMLTADNPDLNFFKYETLNIATNNFIGANKLGAGGFGPVYKGTLADGQEIAVKRLSKGSVQGLEEFTNEVIVILKLQHRNLVRLLGCCVEGDEKMLIYEYMPNKSLDAYLFDPTKRALLDWRKRFQIIEGISRGTLYLHRDSRLRVIHRDLKASNILLDEQLHPKISDFGMARIFRGNELEANTIRVVGTYGYMPPEYVMEGQFSEKSDCFSFGVLLLEIVSGKRNSSFYYEETPLSLSGYAWQLWNEQKLQSFIDPSLLSEPIFEAEILRCIHVGLLCVQDFAKDRPNMSTTLSMLVSEIAVLPIPKQPAFMERRISTNSNLPAKSQNAWSINNLSITNVEGR
ncbi:hypothetical protein MKW92_007016 [Papaver armeniacum]|nr:hypothetical protein MKW92_007016 [Papaver armeniacum]